MQVIHFIMDSVTSYNKDTNMSNKVMGQFIFLSYYCRLQQQHLQDKLSSRPCSPSLGRVNVLLCLTTCSIYHLLCSVMHSTKLHHVKVQHGPFNSGLIEFGQIATLLITCPDSQSFCYGCWRRLDH